ncbi:hypothetical protein [Mesorhizobium sp. M0276]|uniref:hypothetical protein n=1 Tax=Mesorhizobium sp. M0276 TaxID=2956928 RepID=UPI0033350090
MGSRTRTTKPNATTVTAIATEADPGASAVPTVAGGSQTPAGTASGPPTGEEGITLSCLMNARYHSAREAFLDAVHRWFMFGVVISGAGAVSALFGEIPYVNLALGTVAAILGAADLAFDLSNRARTHSLMKRRYFELLSDLREGQKTIVQAEACVHRYSADEEPAYQALLNGSWNAAQEMVYGDSAKLLIIPVWHRRLQNIWRFEGYKYS